MQISQVPALGKLALPVLRTLGNGDWKLLRSGQSSWSTANCGQVLQDTELAVCSFAPTQPVADMIRFGRIDATPNYDTPGSPYMLSWSVKSLPPPVTPLAGVGVSGAAAAQVSDTVPGLGGRIVKMRGVRLECYTPGVFLSVLYFQGDAQGHAASFQQDLATAKTLAQRIIAALPKATVTVDQYGEASQWPGKPQTSTARPSTNTHT